MTQSKMKSDIRSHWERGLEAAEKRCKECREQIDKNTRLIALLEEKMNNKKD